MARGFIRGALWGAGISFGAVTLISVAGDGPGETSWKSRMVSTAADKDQTSQEAKGSTANRVALDVSENSIPSGPLPDTLSDVSAAAFDTALVPQTGLASNLPQANLPETSARDGLAATDTTAPKVSGEFQTALTTPATEPDLSISTEPAQPQAPEAEQQQTAFADPASVNTPAVDQQKVEPAPIVADSVTDLSQPEISEAVEPTVFPAEEENLIEEAPTQIVEAAPTVQDSISGLDTPDTTSAAPESVAVVGDVDDVVTPETVAPVVIAKNEDEEPAIDAPQPEATTDLVLALAGPQNGPSTRLPQISTEADAPDVTDLSDLETPASTDIDRAVADSSSVSVTASVELDSDVSAPLPKSLPVAKPAEQEVTAPEPADAPEILQVSSPDPVAIADLSTIEPIPTSETSQDTTQPVREVKVNRLPSLGASTATAPVVAESETAALPDADVLPVEEGAIPVLRYAQPFENPDGKPVMAIVLVDEGTSLEGAAIGLPALRQLPYPVSFAVDTSLPDAPSRMRAYRQEGFEVLALVNLPEGATATDAEVNLSVALERMPEVVGVLEGMTTGVQTTRDSGRQVAQILAQTGHGFVTQNKGLNTVQKLSARAGVPSAVVFRDFDAQGQSARVIGRFLDQAAFRARQEGSVVMLGRMREETIAALLVWALQERASQVALAPVTGALSTQEQ